MNTKELIEMLLNYAKELRNQVTVILLTNVKNITPNNNNYEDSSILTEFLSMNEYNELLTSIQDFGFYSLTYFDTNDFIKDYYSEKFKNTQLVIFEGTQKGIGRARDAFIPSFCDLENLVHTGPNAYVNSICTNKYHWTKLLEFHNISVPHSWRYYDGMWLGNQTPMKKIVLIAKPCYECASIGIHKKSVAQYSNDYETYLKRTSQIYNQPLIVQEFISGYEVEVPIIIHQKKPYVLSPIILYKNDEILMGKAFLDFDNINDDDYNFCLLEHVNSVWSSHIQLIAKEIVYLLELECYTRIDFRITTSGEYFVTDINSYPHIVNHSSFAYAFEQMHIDSHYVLPSLIGNVLVDG